MRKFYLFALVAMMFAACTTDETQDLRPVDAPETLTVGFEGGDDNTRVQLNEAGKTVWTKGDLVSVFYRSDANQKWQFQGETGERIADLYRVDAGSATETMRRVVVVYPYNENYYINTETYNVQASLPATQHYLADSYSLDGNIMISSGEYNNISLKSVCGWLKLQLTGSGEKVQSITLKGNNGEQVAGELYINSADATAILSSDKGSGDDGETGGAGGGLVFEDTILKDVTLDCGDGVTLGTEATAFYIALPPQTFETGLTVEIETTEGKIMGQYTDKEIVIERNTIQPMTALEFEEKIAINQIRYTSSNGKIVTPNATDVFGANIVSNTYDKEAGYGTITFDGKVTSIGEDAFYYCTSLTSINIPDSVTSIGEYAFRYCTSLKRVDITDLSAWCKISFDDADANPLCNGAKLYINNTEATNITIPSDITKIKSYAFCRCTSLTSVTIPDSVTSIERIAFQGCSSLTSVNIPDSVTEIGYSAFWACSSLTRVDITDLSAWCKISFDNGFANPLYNEAKGAKLYINNAEATNITIPSDITEIKSYAFYNYKSLTSVTIPDSVTSIGNIAFDGCTSLTSITIPDSVTSIGEDAFRNCTSLTSITIPDSVTEIGSSAFGGCTSLTSITIPDSVTSIGDTAFSNCTSLKAFYGKFASEDNRCLIVNGVLNSFAPAGITSYTIPDSVTSIGNYAFEDCTSLKSVTIPNSVTEIGERAFSDCDSLTSVTIPDSVTKIERSAFTTCDSLTSVTIGNGVTSIGSEAFRGCTSLKEVYCKPTTPPAGGNRMFSYYDGGYKPIGCKIYVPTSDDDSIINAYKAKQYWSDYASYIEEYDFSAGQ